MSALDVYKLCISRVRKKGLKPRLVAIEPLIEEADQEYDDAATAGSLHIIGREEIVGGNVSRQELMDVYTYRMVPKTGPGRTVYEAIYDAADGECCPLCGIQVATTLDHHLPKSEYARLTVSPNNLIPSCEWCQGWKMEYFPATQADQTFHPYYDNFEDELWLGAAVEHTVPASFRFFVNPPDHWDAIRAARAEKHLSKFHLDHLFGYYAAQELINIRHDLSDLLVSNGADSVSAHLRRQARSRRSAQLNSWQSAMYDAAWQDGWFCGGGFSPG